MNIINLLSREQFDLADLGLSRNFDMKLIAVVGVNECDIYDV